jgi:hypothetical protein
VEETAKVCAIFKRTGHTNDANRGWRLSKLSLARGQSITNTVRIDSLRIQTQTSNINLVISNPLTYFYNIDSLITFNAQEFVTLTLYTNATNSEAFLHTFILAWPYYVRLKFNKLGNGVFSGTWRAQTVTYPRFALFDVINHNTLYNQNSTYDFNGWFLPYNIKTN